jgi:EAL domain-containing protein (putative c-di-GMP-specific phosphodiesterase class I)
LHLRELIEREVELSGLQLSVQASIGFVLAPQDGTDIDTLLQRADVAMYLAKVKHIGVVHYDAALDHYDAAALGLATELRHAIDDGQLVLHPTRGLVPPDKFLPIAEQTELIEQLTKWVLRTALSEVRDLERVWDEDLAVAVNVSARSISRAGFAEDIIETLQALDVPAQRLIIEVTETALMTDPAGAAGILAKLAAAGVNISLDDFGRGQTSLGYLSALPVHEMKIDKSFVLDMLQNPAHAAIVRSIIDLGHNLGLRVVGEGVETDDVLTALREAGCDVAQGFLFALPKPVGELRRSRAPVFEPPAAAQPRPGIPGPRTAAVGI